MRIVGNNTVPGNRAGSNMSRGKTGIIVLGHSRPVLLQNVLESLRRQGRGNDIHVWLDGHAGRPLLVGPVQQCRELVIKQFPNVHLSAINGNIGIEKLMIDGLSFMSSRYDRIIVLEDDCFPTSCAIEEFEKALDEIQDRPEVYSVYGHHFLTESEGETITRFQGWGWATTRRKLLAVLAEMKKCFAMAEPDYLRWVQRNLTPEVVARLDVTPGRNCITVAQSFFCWDACTCLITAARRLVHKKTTKRVIYNCGMGDGSMHFADNERFRRPPFNMIAPKEVWDYYNGSPESEHQQRYVPQVICPPGPNARTVAIGKTTLTGPGLTDAKGEENNKQGENLIFLISQPRAGSTLLQRILAGHPEVHTLAEPWIMLHPVYALKRKGIKTEYESDLAREALGNFLADVPESYELYIKALREMGSVLYDRALGLSGKRFFLDKTPRYYYIIPELYRIFPKANFIILLRNPMAVLSSVLATWAGNRPEALLKTGHYADVMEGPHYIIEGMRQLKEKAIVVHYENLVMNSKRIVWTLCERLGLRFYESMLQYGLRPLSKGRFGDLFGIVKHDRAVSDYVDKWVKNLTSPELVEFAHRYLTTLGSQVFSYMGYPYDQIKTRLESQMCLQKNLSAKIVQPNLPPCREPM